MLKSPAPETFRILEVKTIRNEWRVRLERLADDSREILRIVIASDYMGNVFQTIPMPAEWVRELFGAVQETDTPKVLSDRWKKFVLKQN